MAEQLNKQLTREKRLERQENKRTRKEATIVRENKHGPTLTRAGMNWNELGSWNLLDRI